MRRFLILLIPLILLQITSTEAKWPFDIQGPRSSLVVPDDYQTIEEAYANVKDGGTITIKPGKYELSKTLVVDRNVTFRGDTSDPESVMIHSASSTVFKVTGGSPSFQNLTASSDGSEDGNRFGISITGGTPNLFRCVVASYEGTGLNVEGKEANPNVEKSIIKNCGRLGVWVGKEGRGKFRDCEIYGNKYPGIVVEESGNPTVTGCKIHDGKDTGVLVWHEGHGEFSDCEIYGNALAGICVQESGNPTFTGCKIRDGKQNGVLILQEGRGEFIDCEIYGNEYAGIAVKESGNPTVTGCKIYDGKDCGVGVGQEGLGTFTDCEIYGNEYAGIQVEESGNPTVTRCKIHDGKYGGVFVLQEGLGEFRDCEIYGNENVGIAVAKSGNPTVTGCKIHDGKYGGVYIHDKGMGTFNNNTLSENYFEGKLSNWYIDSTAGEVKGSGNTPEIPKR